MTFKTTKLRDAISFALAVGVTAAAGTGIAFAQETTAPEGQDATTLDRIEVTGSRIKRTDVETSQPIFTLDRADIQAQGLTSVGDVIQNLTANGSTLNTTMNNGGNGETRVNLRNLGSNRTLVLVNGRRWVGGTGLGGAVDLNTIPTAAVERIEVLKDGASTIYGSDAIAGVVNVILRQDFDGAEVNAYIGQFDKGDGTRESFDLTVGSSGERFSAMFGAGYVKEEPVMAGDRAISAEPIFGTGTSFGSSTTPNGRFAVCNGVYNPVTATCSGTQTQPGGAGGTFTYNPYNPALSAEENANADRPFILPPADPNDIYNFAPDNYLITPQERKSLFAQASLDITDDLRFVTSATYNNRLSEQLLAAMPVVLGTGPGAGVQSRTVSISPDSMYNPFGVPVSRVQRRVTETGGRSFRQNVDTFAWTGSLEGSFERWDRYFSWDAGMTYGRNDSNNTTLGLFNVLALRNALGPSMLVNGTPTCVSTAGNAATAIAGCVPLNLLGGVGSITQEMLDYSTFVAHDEFNYTMKQYFANVTGDIVELPGGMMAFAAGLERRTESGYDSPDALINSGNTTGNSRTATAGGYKVEEAYLELAVPLLKDLPGARELEFNVATRYSNYDNFGNTVNSKFGFKWRPIDDLLVRGNWSEGFRAPSISELFSGLGDSFPGLSDPCSTTFGGGYNDLNATQQARCHAAGVPVGGYDQGNAQIRISVGGNPNLLPEKSTTKTLGLVWSPSFFEGFDVSLDWWEIELTDAVVVFSGQFIIDACIEDGNAQACALQSRGPGGAIDTLISAGLNVGAQHVEGYDMTMNYRLPEQTWGKLSFSWDTTYLADNQSDNDADGDIDAADGGNVAGEYDGATLSNNWRIRSNLLARWELGDVGATWATRYYSGQDEACPFPDDYGFSNLCSDPGRIVNSPVTGLPEPAGENRMDAATYHDVSFYWKAPWNAKVTIGVNNLFDEDPPVSLSTFANSFDPQYEIPGQFYYLQYNQKF